MHVVVAEGIVGFDSDLSYNQHIPTVEPVFQVDLSFCSPLSMAQQEYDRWLGEVEALFANSI